jgi:surfeit locus 1 family protein
MLKRALIALAALLGIAATLSLGYWQWGRAQQKIALHETIARREVLPALAAADLLAARDDSDKLLHRTIQLRGKWIADRTVWLDNRQMNGIPGFYVVTPLRIEGSDAVVLVQRGWAQRNFSKRDLLPPIQTPAGVVELRGRLAPPPAKLYAFGTEESGVIRQNLDLARFQAETRLLLLPLSVQQTGSPSQGLLRQWPQAGSGAEKNYGYAFQWWALASLIAILYVWFQLVSPRRRQARGL